MLFSDIAQNVINLKEMTQSELKELTAEAFELAEMFRFIRRPERLPVSEFRSALVIEAFFRAAEQVTASYDPKPIQAFGINPQCESSVALTELIANQAVENIRAIEQGAIE